MVNIEVVEAVVMVNIEEVEVVVMVNIEVVEVEVMVNIEEVVVMANIEVVEVVVAVAVAEVLLVTKERDKREERFLKAKRNQDKKEIMKVANRISITTTKAISMTLTIMTEEVELVMGK